jgi:2-oxo-4-hydroxy-4-carboxy-5-ureidoimidazoline decarboxylase
VVIPPQPDPHEPDPHEPDPHGPDPYPPAPPPGLATFNTAPAEAAERALLACLRCPRWARRLTGHRPYPDLAALLAAADEAAYDLGRDDLAEALVCEPAPWPPPGGHPGAYMPARTALSAAHAAYHARFGHVFVMHVDGLAPDEVLDHVLASIRRRLAHDVDEEFVQAAGELRALARTRLAELVMKNEEFTLRDA